MFQWDTSFDLGGQNVLKTSEMAIRYNRQTTPAELECSVAGFIFTNIQKYCPGARFSKLLKKILGKSYEKLTTNL